MRRVESRDLRSLERRNMYSIFHALDPDERLPRELILEGRRYRFLDTKLQIAAVLCLPAVALLVFLLGSVHAPPAIVYAAAGMLLGAFFVYVLRHKPN